MTRQNGRPSSQSPAEVNIGDNRPKAKIWSMDYRWGWKAGHAVTNSIERDDQFSTTVTQSRVKPRHAEIVLVSLQGPSVDYLGISQVGRRVATGQVTIAWISNLVEIDDLPCEKIEGKLPSRFSKWFDPPSEGAWRPTPRLWEEILKVVRAERPSASQNLDELNRLVAASRPVLGRIAGGLEVFERDAVASALQTFGGSAFRKKVLRRAGPPPKNLHSGSIPLPASGGLSSRRSLDYPRSECISGMEVSRRDVVGSVVFTNGVEDLTILNCNRQPLEQTLGVDLIYYSHRFDSFVLVQYKRMSEGKRGAEYRPGDDQSHNKELQCMTEAEEVLGKLPKMKEPGTSDFRLSSRPFYLKLCEPKAKAALDAGMVSGMYVPLDLWRSMLDFERHSAPKAACNHMG